MESVHSVLVLKQWSNKKSLTLLFLLLSVFVVVASQPFMQFMEQNQRNSATTNHSHELPEILQFISANEYHISPVDSGADGAHGYQATNRVNQFRSEFSMDSVRLYNREYNKQAWSIHFSLHELQTPLSSRKANLSSVIPVKAAKKIVVKQNRIEYQWPQITEWYINDQNGLEQGFTLHSALSGDSMVSLLINVSTELFTQIDRNGDLKFISASGEVVLKYGHLVANDATGRQLPSVMSFSTDTQKIKISVDVSQAIYPVIIDPLFSSRSQQITLPASITDAWLGHDVSSAGDVNGDGYSDLIVGAPHFDTVNGGIDAGKVFVYYGGPTGIDVSNPSFTIESSQAGSLFGSSVAHAGDVNGDGYSDVVIGAPMYESSPVLADEGFVFFFLGSAIGLQAASGLAGPADAELDSFNFITGGQAGAQFGYSVAGARDIFLTTNVQGNRVSEVAIGAPYYDQTATPPILTDVGAVFVFNGIDIGDSGITLVAADAEFTHIYTVANALFGFSVSSAGDFNDDGYFDLLVGAPHDSFLELNAGSYTVFFGTANGLNRKSSQSKRGQIPGAQFGFSVASAGDVNGDGVNDIVMGTPYMQDPSNIANSPTNDGYILVHFGYFGGITGNTAEIYGNEFVISTAVLKNVGIQFGYDVASAGDWNGDGFADIIVGAPAYSYSSILPSNDGAAFIVQGGSGNRLNPIPGLTLEGAVAEGTLGSSVAAAGDVDGDGFSDILLGAKLVSSAGGKVEIHFGIGDGVNRQASRFVDGNGAYGFQTKPIGDVNGDGFSDIAVSSPSITMSGNGNVGMVDVYYGATEQTPSFTTSDWTLASGVINGRFGYSLDGAGDVNGDGYDDIIVGAYSFNDSAISTNIGTSDGRAFVFHGSANGLVNIVTGSASVSELLNLSDWSVRSNVPGARLGQVVKGVGDLNGDGYDDVAITHLDTGGSVDVYYGSAIGLDPNQFSWRLDAPNVGTSGQSILVSAAGDVNNDGYDDLLVRTLTTGNATIYVFYGAATGLEADAATRTTTPETVSAASKWKFSASSNTYATALAHAGDVNGDGYSDIIVGDPDAVNAVSENLGQVYVFYGSASGLDATPSWTMKPTVTPTTTVDGFSHSFGAAVASVGDINQDGYGDVIIGEPLYQDQVLGLQVGRILIYTGSSTGLSGNPEVILVGDSNLDRFGNDVGNAGDINGDGYSDFVVGEYNRIEVGVSAGRAYAFFGNNNLGPIVLARQKQYDAAQPSLSWPLSLGGQVSGTRVMLKMFANTPVFGATNASTEWEIKPRGIAFDGVNTIVGNNWSTTTSTATLLSDFAPVLPAGESYHWRARFRYDPLTAPASLASIWYSPAGNSRLETDFKTAPVSVSGGADLGLSVSATGPVKTGDMFNYTFEVLNAGPDAAKNLTLTINLPSTVTSPLVTAGDWTCGFANPANIITCTLTSLVSSASPSVVSIAVTAPLSASTLTGSAVVSSLIVDPGPNINYANFSTIVDSSGNTTVNTLPVAGPVAQQSTKEDVFVDITLIGSDVDADTLTFSIVKNPTIGDLGNLQSGNIVRYTPKQNLNGADSFDYKVDDGRGGVDTATVVITVIPDNDAPLANNFAINVVQDTIYSGSFDVIDIDSDTFVYEIITQANKGIAVEDSESNRFSYTPNAAQVGLDSFTYRVTDSAGATSAIAGVTVNINTAGNIPPNDPVLFLPSNNTTLVTDPINFVWEALDPNGDILRYTLEYCTDVSMMSSSCIEVAGISAKSNTLASIYTLTGSSIGLGLLGLMGGFRRRRLMQLVLMALLVISLNACSNAADDVSAVKTKPTNAVEYIAADLQANTQYWWKVSADDNKGGTSNSDVWTFTTL